jgi:signal transduction histidine kinase
VEARRIAKIVKNLLGFARQDKQPPNPARMIDIVTGTLSLVATVMRHDKIILTVDVPDDLPTLTCRSQQIQQVLMNLLNNARDALNEKYTGQHEDKTIKISARARGQGVEDGINDPSSSDFRSPHSDRRICLTVEDHGGGIALEARERIFDPFFTTKPLHKGTGLGLSISHGLIKDHGGELSVESEPGQWTRFHVDLPIEEGG